MKKVLVAILAIVYLVVSGGIAINIHYCMGKVASVDLVNSNDKCGKCGMKTTGGCCKDEFKIVKLSDTHKLIATDIKIFAPVALIDNTNSIFNSELPYSIIPAGFKNHSPPEPYGSSLTILYRVFRI